MCLEEKGVVIENFFSGQYTSQYTYIPITLFHGLTPVPLDVPGEY